MTFSPLRMASRMMDAWNSVPADQETINKLGDAMFEAILSIIMDQQSDPDGSLGRARFRKLAEAILNGYTNDGGEPGHAGGATIFRFKALANAIQEEIHFHAEIDPLEITVQPGGSPPHTHVATTVVGKIKII